MINNIDEILAKSPECGGTSLARHLADVADAAVIIARHCGMDEKVARMGALLHDIGKASPVFQRSLKKQGMRRPGFVWRHEIASLLFISLAPEQYRPYIVDMIVAHHKSVGQDATGKGLLDLDDNNEDCYDLHAKGFSQWSTTALDILLSLGMEVHPISEEEARDNYEYAVKYCRQKSLGCSLWKGLLMAADHMASALDGKYKDIANRLFVEPDLSFYNRTSPLYPLSLSDASDERRHTMVTAPTGAGKTDFLMRRCRGRVFYTLPFQASINAMYDRINSDLSDTDAEVTLLHSVSDLKMVDGTLEERIMQRHVGASVKVMTPHQMASVAFGIKGYEAMAVDLMGCDVILDEIHTYTSKMQAIVCKIIEILVKLGCRIHVGTATMPTVLYERIMQILGGPDGVYEVKLSDETLETFNRHIIHKCQSVESVWPVVEKAVREGRKILLVCNQVNRAQMLYQTVRECFPRVDCMLIHSRFKRGRRGVLESRLRDQFNVADKACIVVSTQVVEVSLDISFDVMITECAPIDAMIQRFGRINRKRNEQTIGHYKPIYVIQPPAEEGECRPYEAGVLKMSYEVLPDGELLHETSLQTMIDKVYHEDKFINIDYSGVVFKDGQWLLNELWHRSKSALLDLMNFNSAVCILQSDEDEYLNSERMRATELEIPVSYHAIAHGGYRQLERKNRPFVVPDNCYDDDTGLSMSRLKDMNKMSFEFL